MTESGGIGIHGRLKICCLSACGFESRLSDSGLIVQLGERCLCKAEVGGSSPPQSTNGRMAEWLKALVLKTGVGIRCLPWVRIPLLPPYSGRLHLHKHSVESNKRAARRHAAETLKKRYKKYSNVTDPNDEKRVGQVFQCPQSCSCHMCCNDRRNPYAKKDRITIQEHRHLLQEDDGIGELVEQ